MSRSAASDLDQELNAGESSASSDFLHKTSALLILQTEEEEDLDFDQEELKKKLISLDELIAEQTLTKVKLLYKFF